MSIPEQALTQFAAVAGYALGALFGISGLGDQSKSDDLSKNQRAKNPLWLLTGATASFLVDWKFLSKNNEVTPDIQFEMLESYIRSAGWSMLATVIFFVIGISMTVRWRAMAKPQFKGRYFEFIFDYLFYGYKYYCAKLREADLEISPVQQGANTLAQLGRATAAGMAVRRLVAGTGDKESKQALVDQLLEAIENTVKLFCLERVVNLNTNYMAVVDKEGLGDTAPLFMDKSIDYYGKFLILRRYRNGQLLPVAIPLETSGNALRILPGAPTSAIEKRACYINPKRPSFRADVPDAIQKQIKSYFNRVGYASVLCVPLMLGRDVVGVVNVESDQLDVIGKGTDMVSQIGEALSPLCALLLANSKDSAMAEKMIDIYGQLAQIAAGDTSVASQIFKQFDEFANAHVFVERSPLSLPSEPVEPLQDVPKLTAEG